MWFRSYGLVDKEKSKNITIFYHVTHTWISRSLILGKVFVSKAFNKTWTRFKYYRLVYSAILVCISISTCIFSANIFNQAGWNSFTLKSFTTSSLYIPLFLIFLMISKLRIWGPISFTRMLMKIDLKSCKKFLVGHLVLPWCWTYSRPLSPLSPFPEEPPKESLKFSGIMSSFERQICEFSAVESISSHLMSSSLIIGFEHKEQ